MADCGRGRPKERRGIWSLAGSGRPSAAPRWPTSAETVGGLRPRHWPPVNDHGGPYWIRLESALTMAKPEDEANTVEDDGGTFEYRVDVPASEQRLPVGEHHHPHHNHHHHHHHHKTSSQQQETYLGNGNQYPSLGTQYPRPDSLQAANSHQYQNTGHQFPTDGQQGVGGQQHYPGTEQSFLCNGHRYPPSTVPVRQYPVSTQPGTEQVGDDEVIGCNDDGGGARTVIDSREEGNSTNQQQRYDPRGHHQCRHHDSSLADDVIVTSPVVEPPRYELFTHV